MELRKNFLEMIVFVLFLLFTCSQQADKTGNTTQDISSLRLSFPAADSSLARPSSYMNPWARTINIEAVKQQNFKNNKGAEILHRKKRFPSPVPGNKINVSWNTTYLNGKATKTNVYYYQTIGESFQLTVDGDLPVGRDQIMEWARNHAEDHGKVIIPYNGPHVKEEASTTTPQWTTTTPRWTTTTPRWTTTTPRWTTTTEGRTTTTRRPYRKPSFNQIFPTNCGRRTKEMGDKIFHGRKSSIEESPWQVSLYRITTGAMFCGGAIITSQHVVTAAHCFYDKWENDWLSRDDFIVRVGDFDREVKETGEQEYNVLAMYRHNKFKPYESNRNDITLLLLSEILVFTPSIFPICVPGENVEYRSKQPCQVTGWGVTEKEIDGSRFLRVAGVELVPEDVCRSCHSDHKITGGMVCAGNVLEGGADTCQGDSGGPLVCKDDIRDRHFLYGITSWGKGCGLKHRPGVYTKVSRYYKWIINKILISALDDKSINREDEDVI